MRVIGMRRLRPAMFLAVVGVVVAATLTPATASGGTPAAAKPTKGGTLTVGVELEMPSFSLFPQRIGSLTQGGDRTWAIFGSLLRVDPKTNAPVPYMAESMTTNDGGRTWTMKLKPNIKFTDGTPFNAAAVVFTYKLLQDPKNSFLSANVVNAARTVTAVDDLTVQWVLNEPEGSFNQIFTDIPGVVISPTAYQAAATPTAFWAKPVGAGPFMLKDWVRDQTMTMVKNPTYFDKPKPYLDQLVFKVIPDRTTQMNLLNQKQIDMLLLARGAAINEAQKNKEMQVTDPTKTSGSYGLLPNNDRAPGNNATFREALMYAFDPKASNQVLNGGLVYPGDLRCMPFGPANAVCAKDVVERYDPKKAQKLFDKFRADGGNPDFTFLYNNPGGCECGEFIQQQLAKYGVKVTLRGVPTAQYTQIRTAKDFQVTLIIQPIATYPEIRFYDTYHSAGGVRGGQDVASLNNAALDAAMEKGRYSPKRADQIAGWQDAQRIYQKSFVGPWLVPQPLATITYKYVNLGPEQTINSTTPRFDGIWVTNKK